MRTAARAGVDGTENRILACGGVSHGRDHAVFKHKLNEFVRENEIDIAVLTIPKTSAVGVAEQLVQNGIKAIWNFAHVDLNVPDGIQVENVHLSDSLMKLSYNINRYEKEQK